jgi:hypothetical protein
MLPIVLFAVPLIAQIQISRQPDKITINVDGKEATSFYYGPSVTKPYLWPLRTASGLELTRHWPMETSNSDPHDHIHHRGLWFAHSLVNGFDFWNSDPSYHKSEMGTQVVTAIDTAEGGKDSGTLAADLEWRDPAARVLITEKRTFIFRAGDPRIVDVDIVLTAKEDVTFGDEKDGVLGIRLAHELEEPLASDAIRTGRMTSSEGCHQEAGCWGKRADWLDVSGRFGGTAGGVAVLDHPDNPRFPTYWHARGYGLLAANIFGVKSFTKSDAADGSLKLNRGQTLHFRYRVILHGGDTASAGLPDLYRAWTLR